MITSKAEYIIRSLKKVSHKPWELFAVSRILHGLDDDELEFITQQLVKRPDGSRALTDIYFPQLSTHVEIDEPFHVDQLDADRLREQDIVLVTGHRIERIRIYNSDGQIKSMAAIRADIDELVALVSKLKQDAVHAGSFEHWDWETRYSADQIIARGFLATDYLITQPSPLAV
jgi:hypothetical protein